MKAKLSASLSAVIMELYQVSVTPEEIIWEYPKNPDFGDLACNIAFKLAKLCRRSPMDISTQLVQAWEYPLITNAKAVAGFINVTLDITAWTPVISEIIEQGVRYGTQNSLQGQRFLVEYVSANPTGKLHLGHARGAAWGDSLIRILRACGAEVLSEYYINDAGNQIHQLALSVEARYLQLCGQPFTLPEDGYHGRDIIKISEEIFAQVGDQWLSLDCEERQQRCRQWGLERQLAIIRDDLARYRVQFDSWISEQWLFDQGYVDGALQLLESQGLTYQAEGAIWFAATRYGDDKDRVLRKSDGLYTYLTPDIANHLYKLERGYRHLINLWGADHHSYIVRMQAALTALGHPQVLEVDVIQMVRLVENGQEVKMSKRTGNAITIEQLCDEVGVDAVRYFFAAKDLNSHLDFDLGIARQKSQENPLFYIQYAIVRVCSLWQKKTMEVTLSMSETWQHLQHPSEKALLRVLVSYPETLQEIGKTRGVHKLTHYLWHLAKEFHSYYNGVKILDPQHPTATRERLLLAQAVRQVLTNGLALLGIEAPEQM